MAGGHDPVGDELARPAAAEVAVEADARRAPWGARAGSCPGRRWRHGSRPPRSGWRSSRRPAPWQASQPTPSEIWNCAPRRPGGAGRGVEQYVVFCPLLRSVPSCLGCHATPCRRAERGPRFQPSDGVGCESATAAASGWIASHYTIGGTHAANVAAGMMPLDDPQVRARRMPRLPLRQRRRRPVRQPPDDGRRPSAHRLRARPVLRAAAAPRRRRRLRAAQGPHRAACGSGRSARPRRCSRSLDLFARPGRGSEGVFPEFYFFDCHSCHRAIADGPERTADRRDQPRPADPVRHAALQRREHDHAVGRRARSLAPAQAGAFDAAQPRLPRRRWAEDRARPRSPPRRLGAAAGALSAALRRRGSGGADPSRCIAAIADGATCAALHRLRRHVAGGDGGRHPAQRAGARAGRVTVGAAAGIRADINRAYARCADPDELSTRRASAQRWARPPRRSGGCADARAEPLPASAAAALLLASLRRRRIGGGGRPPRLRRRRRPRRPRPTAVYPAPAQEALTARRRPAGHRPGRRRSAGAQPARRSSRSPTGSATCSAVFRMTGARTRMLTSRLTATGVLTTRRRRPGARRRADAGRDRQGGDRRLPVERRQRLLDPHREHDRPAALPARRRAPRASKAGRCSACSSASCPVRTSTRASRRAAPPPP